MSESSGGAAIGLGSIIAVVVSWQENHSVIWAMIHGVLGWIYLLWHFCVD